MGKNIASFKSYAFLCATVVLFSGCVHHKQIDRQKLHIDIPASSHKVVPASSPPPITIWVHGTLILRTPTYHDIFAGKSILMPMQDLPTGHHFRLIAETIAERDPQQFPLEEFYIFGWPGKLRDQERIAAAHKLYHEIIALACRYREKYSCEPTIRIITHSHGGNLVLNMARMLTYPKSFSIQSLILLACPVQDKTMHLISTSMFERVYSLYSSLDVIQVIAPQFERIRTKNGRRKKHYGLLPFSSRIFPTYSHLTQAKVKINDFPISHTRFSTKEFATLLPPIIQKLDSWHRESIRADKISKYKLLCIYNSHK